MSTGENTLAEANPHDHYWGTGLGKNHPNAFNPKFWKGKNKAGQILMKVRTELHEDFNATQEFMDEENENMD